MGEKLCHKEEIQREILYENFGISFTHLFQLDSETIVDGTIRSSAARFINHAFNPNLGTDAVELNVSLLRELSEKNKSFL